MRLRIVGSCRGYGKFPEISPPEQAWHISQNISGNVDLPQRQTRQARQHPTGPDSTRQPCRQHPTAPDSTHPQLTPEENREHTREAQRPMPEDADQDILERLVCLWPTMRSNRGPTELSSHAKVEELSWCLGWKYSFWQSFRQFFSVQVKELFESLKRPESN